MKEVLFSVIRVVAMFVVAAPLITWTGMDLSAAAFYVGALNCCGVLVYMVPQLAPAVALVLRGLAIAFDLLFVRPLRFVMGPELFGALATCCGCGELSPAALMAKLLSGSVTDAIVKGLFDQENETVQSSGLLVFDSDEAVRARRVLMVATQKMALVIGDLCKEVLTRYRMGYAQGLENREMHGEIDKNQYAWEHQHSINDDEAAEAEAGTPKLRLTISGLRETATETIQTQKDKQTKVDPELHHYAVQFTLKSFMVGHNSGQKSLKGVLEDRVMYYADEVLAELEEAVQSDSTLKHVPGLASGMAMGLMLTIPSLIAACMTPLIKKRIEPFPHMDKEKSTLTPKDLKEAAKARGSDQTVETEEDGAMVVMVGSARAVGGDSSVTSARVVGGDSSVTWDSAGSAGGLSGIDTLLCGANSDPDLSEINFENHGSERFEKENPMARTGILDQIMYNLGFDNGGAAEDADAAEPRMLGERDPMAGRSIRGQVLDDGGVVDRLARTIGLDDRAFDPTAAALGGGAAAKDTDLGEIDFNQGSERFGKTSPLAGRSLRGRLLDDGGTVDRLAKAIGVDDEAFDPTKVGAVAAGGNANAEPGLLVDGGANGPAQ